MVKFCIIQHSRPSPFIHHCPFASNITFITWMRQDRHVCLIWLPQLRSFFQLHFGKTSKICATDKRKDRRAHQYTSRWAVSAWITLIASGRKRASRTTNATVATRKRRWRRGGGGGERRRVRGGGSVLCQTCYPTAAVAKHS